MATFEPDGPDLHLRRAAPLRGVVHLPGSKSLTNRALFCAALAGGTTTLPGASLSDDARRMLAALHALGIHAAEPRPDAPASALTLRGCDGHLPATSAELDLGPAGTAMRFLTALCALGQGRYRLDGSERMRARPIGDLVAALRDLGAAIGYEGDEGCPPLTIAARGLAGGRVTLRDPASSQFVSALLLAAPYAAGDVLLDVRGHLPSRPYLEMTIELMRAFGVELLVEWATAGSAVRLVVPAPQRYVAREFPIEPDASAATYFWTAAALTGGDVRVAGLTRASRQGDVGFVDVLARMGCTVAAEPDGLRVAAPADGPLRGVDVDLNAMPDTVQTLAVAALFAEGPTRIRNVASLRVKETDRIAALERELTRFGARVAAGADELTIHPPPSGAPTPGVRVDTYDDHRMAMSFALAGLRVEGVVIRDAACVSKSFPGYFDVLAGLVDASRARPDLPTGPSPAA